MEELIVIRVIPDIFPIGQRPFKIIVFTVHEGGGFHLLRSIVKTSQGWMRNEIYSWQTVDAYLWDI